MPAEACTVCGRQPGERKPRCIRCAEKPRDRLLPTQLPGSYLVVDPGRSSGWALVRRTAIPWTFVGDHGELGIWSRDVESVVREAVANGGEALVIEKADMGLSPIQAHGLGESAGIWKWWWRDISNGKPVAEVFPGTWRYAILGGSTRSSKEWKADARKHCRDTLSIESVGNESGEAICLAEYALSSLELADAVGVRRLKQLGWAEPRGHWKDGRFVPTDGPGRRGGEG